MIKDKVPQVQYICRHNGCEEPFKYRMGRYRHELKCSYPKPTKEGKGVKQKDNGPFSCISCLLQFSHKGQLTRHEKRCVKNSGGAYVSNDREKSLSRFPQLLAHVPTQHKSRSAGDALHFPVDETFQGALPNDTDCTTELNSSSSTDETDDSINSSGSNGSVCNEVPLLIKSGKSVGRKGKNEQHSCVSCQSSFNCRDVLKKHLVSCKKRRKKDQKINAKITTELTAKQHKKDANSEKSNSKPNRLKCQSSSGAPPAPKEPDKTSMRILHPAELPSPMLTHISDSTTASDKDDVDIDDFTINIDHVDSYDESIHSSDERTVSNDTTVGVTSSIVIYEEGEVARLSTTESKVRFFCANLGCSASFNHRMSRYRHEQKCTKPPPPVGEEQYIKKKENGTYSCTLCHHVIKSVQSIGRHKLSCKKMKGKSSIDSNKCPVCDKVFEFPSNLKIHMGMHKKTNPSCSKCKQTFENKDCLQIHKLKCVGDVFRPTFVSIPGIDLDNKTNSSCALPSTDESDMRNESKTKESTTEPRIKEYLKSSNSSSFDGLEIANAKRESLNLSSGCTESYVYEMESNGQAVACAESIGISVLKKHIQNTVILHPELVGAHEEIFLPGQNCFEECDKLEPSENIRKLLGFPREVALQNESKIKLIDCPYCTRVFDDATELNHHVAIAHPVDEQSSPVFLHVPHIRSLKHNLWLENYATPTNQAFSFPTELLTFEEDDSQLNSSFSEAESPVLILDSCIDWNKELSAQQLSSDVPNGHVKEMNERNYVCGNVGCEESFTYRMAKYRHMKKCKHSLDFISASVAQEGLSFKLISPKKKKKSSKRKKVKQQNGTEKAESNSFVCAYCSRTFVRPDHFKRHQQKCSELSSSMSTIQIDHRQPAFRGSFPSSENKNHICPTSDHDTLLSIFQDVPSTESERRRTAEEWITSFVNNNLMCSNLLPDQVSQNKVEHERSDALSSAGTASEIHVDGETEMKAVLPEMYELSTDDQDAPLPAVKEEQQSLPTQCNLKEEDAEENEVRVVNFSNVLRIKVEPILSTDILKKEYLVETPESVLDDGEDECERVVREKSFGSANQSRAENKKISDDGNIDSKAIGKADLRILSVRKSTVSPSEVNAEIPRCEDGRTKGSTPSYQRKTPFPCSHIGCTELFKHRMSRYRHMKKCAYPPPERSKEETMKKKDDGSYSCNFCNQTIKHINNLRRHKVACLYKKKKKQSSELDVCKNPPKVPSPTSHMQRSLNSNCPKCGKYYKRMDHFKNHLEKCQFVMKSSVDSPHSDVSEKLSKSIERENSSIEMNSNFA